MKYNLKKIMQNAWKIYRANEITFAEALHRAWLSAKSEEINAKRIEMSKQAAGAMEETNTWSGWKKLGYEAQKHYLNVHCCGDLKETEQYIKQVSSVDHR